MDIYKIYAIFNKNDNTVCYVGMTKNSLRTRLNNHTKDVKSSAYAYMHYYGIENFDIKLLEIVKDDKILGYQREVYWTKYYFQFYPLQNKVLGNSLLIQYAKHTSNDIDVVLLNNEQTFYLIEASKKFNVNTQTIIDVCLGRKKNEHGRVWVFAKDYRMTTKQDIENKIITSHSRITSQSIVCTTNGRIFTSLQDASNVMKIDEKDILKSIQCNVPCCYINKVPIIFKKFDKFTYMTEMFKIYLIKQNDTPIFIGMTRETFNINGIMNKLKNFGIYIDNCTLEFLDISYNYHNAKDKVNQFIKIYSKRYNLISKLPIDDKIKTLIQQERISSNHKHILCITTNEIFPSVEHAAKHYHLRSNSILECCFNRRHCCGILENEQKLFWKFTNKPITTNKQLKTKNFNKRYEFLIYSICENNVPIYFGITNKDIQLPNDVQIYCDVFNCEIKELQKVKFRKNARNIVLNYINECKTPLFNNDKKTFRKKLKQHRINYIVGIKDEKYIFIFTCQDNIEKHFHTHLTNLKKKHTKFFKDKVFTYKIIDQCIGNPYDKKQEIINHYKPLFNTAISKDIEQQIREKIKVNNRHVKCIELNLIFENLKIAAKVFKCKTYFIGKHLYGLKEYAFTLKNGTHLHWMYTDEIPNANSFDLSLLKKRGLK